MKRYGFIIFCCMAFLAAILPVGQAAAAEIVITAPDYAGVGDPFTVMVSSEDLPDEGRLLWRGSEIPLDFRKEGNRHFALVMLGSQADEKAGLSAPMEVRLDVRGEEKKFVKKITLRAVDYPVQHLSVPDKMVSPPKEVLDRIKRELAMVKKALAKSQPDRLWEVPFVAPLTGAVTSPYGTIRTMNGVKKGIHTGVDLRAAMGTPVAAPARGIVVLAEDLYFAGKCIYIDHGNGVFSVMMHLSEIAMQAGDSVRAGDVIGKTGRSGRVTGPHLHFGVRVHGKWVNPLPLVAKDQS